MPYPQRSACSAFRPRARRSGQAVIQPSVAPNSGVPGRPSSSAECLACHSEDASRPLVRIATAVCARGCCCLIFGHWMPLARLSQRAQYPGDAIVPVSHCTTPALCTCGDESGVRISRARMSCTSNYNKLGLGVGVSNHSLRVSPHPQYAPSASVL